MARCSKIEILNNTAIIAYITTQALVPLVAEFTLLVSLSLVPLHNYLKIQAQNNSGP